MMDDDRIDGWWTERRVGGGALEFRIGPLSLFIKRQQEEWQVAHRQDDAETESAGDGWSATEIEAMPSELSSVQRFASGASGEQLRLVPRPADRSLVARPVSPLHVLPGAESRFYVSAPVWLEVHVGAPPRPLCIVPTKRLSDTWFGSSTRDGEVAYAVKTQARTRLDEVPTLSYRAITPVVISNRGDDLLQLERMNLPVPYLSIYTCERAHLWTEAVTLVRREDNEMANFEVASGPPREAGKTTKLGEPRIVGTGSPLVRAFGKLLSPFHGET